MFVKLYWLIADQLLVTQTAENAAIRADLFVRNLGHHGPQNVRSRLILVVELGQPDHLGIEGKSSPMIGYPG